MLKMAPLCSQIQVPSLFAWSSAYKMLCPLSLLVSSHPPILSPCPCSPRHKSTLCPQHKIYIVSDLLHGTCARTSSLDWWAPILDQSHSLRGDSSQTGTFSQFWMAPSKLQAKDLVRYHRHWMLLAEVSIHLVGKSLVIGDNMRIDIAFSQMRTMWPIFFWRIKRSTWTFSTGCSEHHERKCFSCMMNTGTAFVNTSSCSPVATLMMTPINRCNKYECFLVLTSGRLIRA